jgi:hypothetical protein
MQIRNNSGENSIKPVAAMLKSMNRFNIVFKNPFLNQIGYYLYYILPTILIG